LEGKNRGNGLKTGILDWLIGRHRIETAITMNFSIISVDRIKIFGAPDIMAKLKF